MSRPWWLAVALAGFVSAACQDSLPAVESHAVGLAVPVVIDGRVHTGLAVRAHEESLTVVVTGEGQGGRRSQFLVVLPVGEASYAYPARLLSSASGLTVLSIAERTTVDGLPWSMLPENAVGELVVVGFEGRAVDWEPGRLVEADDLRPPLLTRLKGTTGELVDTLESERNGFVIDGAGALVGFVTGSAEGPRLVTREDRSLRLPDVVLRGTPGPPPPIPPRIGRVDPLFTRDGTHVLVRIQDRPVEAVVVSRRGESAFILFEGAVRERTPMDVIFRKGDQAFVTAPIRHARQNSWAMIEVPAPPWRVRPHRLPGPYHDPLRGRDPPSRLQERFRRFTFIPAGRYDADGADIRPIPVRRDTDVTHHGNRTFFVRAGEAIPPVRRGGWMVEPVAGLLGIGTGLQGARVIATPIDSLIEPFREWMAESPGDVSQIEPDRDPTTPPLLVRAGESAEPDHTPPPAAVVGDPCVGPLDTFDPGDVYVAAEPKSPRDVFILYSATSGAHAFIPRARSLRITHDGDLVRERPASQLGEVSRLVPGQLRWNDLTQRCDHLDASWKAERACPPGSRTASRTRPLPDRPGFVSLCHFPGSHGWRGPVLDLAVLDELGAIEVLPGRAGRMLAYGTRDARWLIGQDGQVVDVSGLKWRGMARAAENGFLLPLYDDGDGHWLAEITDDGGIVKHARLPELPAGQRIERAVLDGSGRTHLLVADSEDGDRRHVLRSTNDRSAWNPVPQPSGIEIGEVQYILTGH